MTLIDRLSKLDGPDRVLDALITCEAGDESFWGHRLGKNEGTVVAYFDRPNGDIGHSTYKAPRYTASVDAAIALAERVLPNWQVNISRFHDGHAEASVGARHVREPSIGATPAISLCIAILRAKEANHGE